MSLKVVKFNTKMYLNFSSFRGRTSAGGGRRTSLGPKMGTSVGWGVLTKFSPDGGTPSPPGKNSGILILKDFILHYKSGWTEKISLTHMVSYVS